MNGRGGVVRFFIFLLVSIIILLQTVLMVRSDRLHRAVNQLEQALRDTSSEYTAEDQSGPSGAEPDAGCAGDEGDWLVWAFRVEPRTLNPISAEADTYTAWITVPNIFEPLLNYDYRDATLKPWLADQAKAKEDGLQVYFQCCRECPGPASARGVPFRFEFMYSTGYALYERLARLLKDQMVKVGIELAPEPCEWSVVFGRLNDRASDAYVAGWAADTAENPYELWHSSQIGIDGTNYVGFCSKQADQIIEGIATTLDRTERTRLYHRLGRILHEEQAHTFGGFNSQVQLSQILFCYPVNFFRS